MSEPNAVLIGKKPVMNYVLAVITLFQGTTGEVVVKARGQAISRAVDVVEIVRRRFIQDLKVKEVRIGTVQLPGLEGRGPANVSTMEIVLTK